jgi:hypothetical protein
MPSGRTVGNFSSSWMSTGSSNEYTILRAMTREFSLTAATAISTAADRSDSDRQCFRYYVQTVSPLAKGSTR